MRVLMVAHAFPRAADDAAGAVIWRLGEGLAGRGHAVVVIAPGRADDPVFSTFGRIEVRRVQAGGPLGSLRLIRGLMRAVSAECARGDVHLVHAHGWAPAGLAAALANRHSRPLALTLHPDDPDGPRFPGRSLLFGPVLRRAKVVTAVASFLAEEAARATRVPLSAIPITPMPLLSSEPATEVVGISHGVVFVGRLTRDKGLNHLLDALALLKKQGLPLDLTIVGDGPERVALKAHALALALPTVFTGWVAPEQVPDNIAGKRVFVLPSVGAGLGLVVAEALGQGVPVVATRAGGIPDLLTEEAASVLVEPGDAAALAQAIRRVVSDDSFLTGAVNAGRLLVARLSAGSVAAAFEQVYAETRGRRSSARRSSQRISGAQS